MGSLISIERSLNMDSIMGETFVFGNCEHRKYQLDMASKLIPDDEDFEILECETSSIEAKDNLSQPSDLIQLIDEQTWNNPNSESLFVVESLVLRYLESMLHFMKLTNEQWQLKLVNCGLYYEGLSSGSPLQLEYLLELTSVQVSELMLNESRSLNQLSAQLSGVLKGFRATTEHETQDDCFDLTRHMISIMKRYLSQNCRYSGLQLLEVQDTMGSPGLVLYLEYKGSGIMVKLKPAVRFPPYCKDVLPEYSEKALNFVAKVIPGISSLECAREFITGTLHLVFSEASSHFKVSTSVLEMYIMKCLPEHYKQPLRIFLYLCQTHLLFRQSYHSNCIQRSTMLKLFGYRPFLPTHTIKLLFLHHIVDCYMEPDNPHSRGMYHNDKTGLIQALLEDLKGLKYFVYLPNDKCAMMVESLLFGQSHRHRFDFVKALFARDLSKNIGWFDSMINTMELILDEEISSEDEARYRKRFQKLNYPTLPNVKFYPKFCW